ncbi:methylmalonyl-CoA mutase family protein [Nocardioides euryhalodurans]|uniref:Methylmalonyl-CoA mutase n=1 Tax=Nocardioides euryhalodurans TaxID=2518370 RepID=A0A4P7GK87_9ACTN|nr:methylmalonyl-CoA mutase family protein [Nocardioides euryhalodurans]QBR92081.1 methylmalonyl-CoA mutase [Nocardioides euryhalodurans]
MSDQPTVDGGLDEPEDLEPAQGTLALAAPEDRHTRADWERAAAGVLRKARRLGEDEPDDLVWERLAGDSLDGLVVTPLGTPDLLDDLVTRGRPTGAGGWDVRTRPADNEQALADLDTGATSLWVEASADLPVLLDGVLLDLAPVVLEGATPEAARELAGLLGDTDPADGTNLGADAAGDHVVEVARIAQDAGVLAAVVDGTTAHDRGASDVQELGHALATAAAYLRTLVAAGFSVEEAAGLVEFRFAATAAQFPTIAKLRAARRLWARMLELSGAGEVPMRIHAVTSRPMMSRYDPWVNMLRTTVAAFAAGVGGADSVTVLPFDSPLGEPDAFGRRIARNTSHLLLSESHLGRVADPAGGSYAVEKLTDDLAVAAWEELGLVEAEGHDAFWGRVADTVAARDEAVATRRLPITGLTEFPHLDEVLPERPGDGDDVRRWGAAFEELRDDPALTPVFLATMGPVAAHTARAGFAANLLAAGGVAVVPAGPTDGVESVLAAYDGQPVVCLAGTDPAYDEWGADLVTALRDAGARHVVVAGKADVGADDRCFAGVDALAFLRRTREELA